MYLEKRTYVKNWDWTAPEERHEVTVTRGGHPTAIAQDDSALYWVNQMNGSVMKLAK